MRTIYLIVGINVIILLINFFMLVVRGSGFIESLSQLPTSWGALIGALVGLCGVAWTASKGFSNLIAAQEHRAKIEIAARKHQYELDESKYKRDKLDRAQLVAGALQAELVGLLDRVHKQQGLVITQSALVKAARRADPNYKTKIRAPEWSTPIWDNFTSDIGLLGTSIAGDLVLVYSQFANTKHSEIDDVDAKFAEIVYDGLDEGYKLISNDIVHVSWRLASLLHGKKDPGQLFLSPHRRAQRVKTLGQAMADKVESQLKE